MKKDKASKSKDSVCCELCKHNKEFDIPEDLIKALLRGELVIFAGAGVSTEKSDAFPVSLYEDVAQELSLDSSKIGLTFSDLMSRYVKEVEDGRRKLLQKIRGRIEYVKSFDTLYRNVTSFHQELANIYLIKNVITTNWDDFFELETGAIPFVISEDFAFWDLDERKVFKIHGSINNIGSIIATTEDYRRCYKNLSRSPIGAYLRLALATKTIVFIGYSLEDEDFNKIYRFLSREMKGVLPHSYWVSPDKESWARIRHKELRPIFTEGTFFLHRIKKELMSKKLIIDDSIYDFIEITLAFFRKMHIKFSEKKEFDMPSNPNILYSYCFQDGLIDAYQRSLLKRGTGIYLSPEYIYGQINIYLDIRKSLVKQRKYHDIAYVDGYMEGLLSFLEFCVEDKFEPPPFYYVYGYGQIDELKDFRREVRKVHHKGAYEWARIYMKKKGVGKGFVFHHTPFL